MILGRSSLIQTPCTLAQSSMSEHSSPAKTPGLAKRTLQTGLRALHLNPRLRSCHPQRSQRRRNNPDTMEVDEICISEVPNGLAVSIGRIDKKVETKTGDFVTSQAAGEWGMGHTLAADSLLRETRFPNSPTVCTSRVAGRTVKTRRIGCVLNSNSSTTTRNHQ